MELFCPECRETVEYEVKENIETKAIRGLQFEYLNKTAYCGNCGEEIFVSELHDQNLKSIDHAYREEADIITVAEIRKIVEQYNAGKRPLSLMLGWGETTLTRYLDGDIPSKAYSDILKKIKNDYNYMESLIYSNRDKVSNQAFDKVVEAIKDLKKSSSNPETVNKIDVVIKYLLRGLGEVTPLALQKLLYYSQGFYEAFYGEFLFAEDCEAWVHGPVYKDIYFKYRDYGYNPIENNLEIAGDLGLTDLDAEFLENIIDKFGCYSGKTLERMTHAEEPWRLTRKNLKPDEKSNQIISKDLIAGYFNAVKRKYDMLNIEDIDEYSKELFNRIH